MASVTRKTENANVIPGGQDSTAPGDSFYMETVTTKTNVLAYPAGVASFATNPPALMTAINTPTKESASPMADALVPPDGQA